MFLITDGTITKRNNSLRVPTGTLSEDAAGRPELIFSAGGGGSATSAASAVFVFGAATTDPADDERRALPVQYAGTIVGWSVITVDGGAGTITFDVLKNGVSMVGGGTSPSLSGANENVSTPTGWSSTTIVEGDILTGVVDGAPTAGTGEVALALKIQLSGSVSTESLISVFGNGTTDPLDDETRGAPMQWAGSFSTWNIMTIDGGTGTLTFDIKKNGTSMVGGGTKPSLVGAASSNGTITDWTTVTFVAGDLITIIVDGTPSGGPGEVSIALAAVRT